MKTPYSFPITSLQVGEALLRRLTICLPWEVTPKFAPNVNELSRNSFVDGVVPLFRLNLYYEAYFHME